MLDWLVIGGGPHGVHTALRLLAEGGVPRGAVRILDTVALTMPAARPRPPP